MPTLINPQPWMPGFKIGNACVMPLTAYFSMATSQYERLAAQGIQNVEMQVARMMKEAVDHARTRS